MQAVILAAGKGSRLQPLTFNRSKAMMPIAGKTMLARVMDMLKKAGLREFIVVAHPDDLELRASLADQPEVSIVLQTERKGMAHALGCAAPLIHDDFVLSACDNLVDQAEINAFVRHFLYHPEPRPAGLLALTRVSKDKIKSMGMITWDGQTVQQIVEKPAEQEITSDVVSLPLYCFSRRFLEYLPRIQPSRRGEHELQDGIQMLINDTGGVCGEMFSGRLTVTDAKDLLDINLRFLNSEAAYHTPPAHVQSLARFTPPVIVESNLDIAPDCQIGPNVLLETGATIGRGARVNNAIVLRGAHVPPGMLIENMIFA